MSRSAAFSLRDMTEDKLGFNSEINNNESVGATIGRPKEILTANNISINRINLKNCRGRRPRRPDTLIY